MTEKTRKFLPAFAELIDRLSVDQIKEVTIPSIKEDVAKEMDLLCHDIDIIIDENSMELSSRFIRIIIALSQLNLHIWKLKDQMEKEPDKYDELLKLAHQLNGIRNQLKNMLLSEENGENGASKRTNFNTDGLEGWNISIN